MKTTYFPALAACGLWLGVISAIAQGTAFTYQGRLNDGGSSATGSYELRFSIYEATSEVMKARWFCIEAGAMEKSPVCS